MGNTSGDLEKLVIATASISEVASDPLFAVITNNPTLKAFYQRRIARSKKPIVALTALMRKLITIIKARIRDARRTPSAN